MSNKADVIIIGAGIHGASLAFHLSQRGALPIVLERSGVASGATGRSDGFVRMHYDLEVEARLAWLSFEYFLNWGEIVGGDCGFRRTGFLQLIRPDFEDRLRANVAMHQSIGIPSLVVSGDDVGRLVPGLNTDDFRLAAYEPESGYADASSAAMSLMQAARDRGAELVSGCRVTGIRVHGGRVIGVDTPLGKYDAPVVVNAAGPWAGDLGRMVGLELPVQDWRHDTTFIKRPGAAAQTCPIVIDDLNSLYFRPEGRDMMLAGVEDVNDIGGSPDRDVSRITAGIVEVVVERLCRRFPVMEHGTVHSTQSGHDGMTPDQRALLGQYGPDGFFVACGFSGSGFKIAPIVGKCLSELILDGRPETVDISTFSPSRFVDGRPLIPPHPYAPLWRGPAAETMAQASEDTANRQATLAASVTPFSPPFDPSSDTRSGKSLVES